jgi:hypothetical protein
VNRVFLSYLDIFGTTAPHWKTKDKVQKRHNIEDPAEFDHRLGVFTKTLQEIIKLNAYEATHNLRTDRAFFGVTKFADWTWEEFKTMLSHGDSPRNSTIPKDLRNLKGRGGMPPCTKNWAVGHESLFTPRNQGACGSCYAHAAAEEIRAMAFINAGFDPGPLSVQYIIDCQGNGCSGGDAGNTMDWVHRQGGIPAKADYGPYSAHRESCKRGIPFAVTTSGAERHRAEADTAQTICNKGPTSMGVLANSAFQMYRGGVLSHSSCPAGPNNHDTQAVAIVSTGGQGAWLIRNSWGQDWGVDPIHFKAGTPHGGYILLEYGWNTCNVEQLNSIPMNVVKAHGCTGGSCDVPAPGPTPPSPANSVCENTCRWARDGTCDDGGPGSGFPVCNFGADCADCGPRTVQGCDTCRWANDGACDEPFLCDPGTDCTDCQ